MYIAVHQKNMYVHSLSAYIYLCTYKHIYTNILIDTHMCIYIHRYSYLCISPGPGTGPPAGRRHAPRLPGAAERCGAPGRASPRGTLGALGAYDHDDVVVVTGVIIAFQNHDYFDLLIIVMICIVIMVIVVSTVTVMIFNRTMAVIIIVVMNIRPITGIL